MTLITYGQRQLFEMTELERSQSDQGSSPINAENASHRSRASSIISTGTKFSISTMPPGHSHLDGVIEGSNRRDIATRPTSLYSVRSMAPSLPPYEGHQPIDAMLSTGAHHSHLSAIETSIGGNSQFISSIGNDPEQPSTPSEPENALSMHYGRVVRTIDENHARQLARIRQDHEQQLAVTRNAIDEAYRKEFKAKNREIERIREEAANEVEHIRRETAADVAAIREEIKMLSGAHEETVSRIQRENSEQLVIIHEEYQAAIEKAKHAIEDLWESRWHDRIKVAAEEAQRRDEKRDSEWLRAVESTHPELVENFKIAMHIP